MSPEAPDPYELFPLTAPVCPAASSTNVEPLEALLSIDVPDGLPLSDFVSLPFDRVRLSFFGRSTFSTSCSVDHLILTNRVE